MPGGRSTQPFNRWLFGSIVVFAASVTTTNLLSEHMNTSAIWRLLVLQAAQVTSSTQLDQATLPIQCQSEVTPSPVIKWKGHRQLQIKCLWRTCNPVLQGAGHVRERHDTVRQWLVPSYACRKIEAAFQWEQERLLVGGLVQSWLLLLRWQPIFPAVWRWMLVLQASPVTSSTQALLAHRSVSKQPWEWKQKLGSGFILLKAASYNRQSGAIHLIECEVSKDNSPFNHLHVYG